MTAPAAGPVQQLVLASRNSHKVQELHRMLADAGIEVLALPQSAPDVREDGATFAQNAMLKARAAMAATGLPALADDSGLVVDLLGAAPGILSARWCGRHGDDRANVQLLLAQLADVPPPQRAARFVCAAALSTPAGVEFVSHGEWAGRLLTEPRGCNGFGYDPVFLPEGSARSAAELSPEEKNAISHRAVALAAMVAQLPILLAADDQ